MIRFPLYFLNVLLIGSCSAQVNTSPQDPYQVSHPKEFGEYWYEGKAEINRFDLDQSRYGEVRKGEAVLVFVTEDFLLEEQVKKEFGNDRSTSVLKSNLIKKFTTGIYDYSLMTSAFTPVDFRKHPSTLKITFSSQDWCGHSFSQMNLKDRRLKYQWHSYFQAEGDREAVFDATYVEEDIWTRIRLEPQTLPLGKVQMVPSLEYLRLEHKEVKPYQCEANLFLQVNDSRSGEEFYSYQLYYPELDRKLIVKCESLFPFRILGWQEVWNSSDDHSEITTAELKNTIKSDYWNKNMPNNKALRDSLGLQYGIR